MLKNILSFLLTVALIGSFFYCLYWVYKTFSYQIFYEDMVIETIQETVKQEVLR